MRPLSEGGVLVAGRELDALVAERVFGWERHALHYPGDFVQAEAWRQYEKGRHFAHIIKSHEWMRGDRLPEYSTDIASAWEVVEKMDPAFAVQVQRTPSGEYECMIWGHVPGIEGWGVEAYADTAPLAICLAAIKATTLHTNSEK